MSVIEDGGPAFPAPEFSRSSVTEGMSIRDYFAAKAMDGFNKYMVDYGWDHDVLVGHAKQAYAVADAMLEVRKIKQGEQT